MGSSVGDAAVESHGSDDDDSSAVASGASSSPCPLVSSAGSDSMGAGDSSRLSRLPRRRTLGGGPRGMAKSSATTSALLGAPEGAPPLYQADVASASPRASARSPYEHEASFVAFMLASMLLTAAMAPYCSPAGRGGAVGGC